MSASHLTPVGEHRQQMKQENLGLFHRLPIEMIENIFLQADLKTLSSLCTLNKQGSEICRNPFFWRNKAILDGLISSSDEKIFL